MEKNRKSPETGKSDFEIVDISYGSGRLTDDPSYRNDKLELWAISKNSKELTKIHLNDDSASITKRSLCKKIA